MVGISSGTIRGCKIEYETVLPLAVTVDAAHALFKAVRIPGDIIIKENMAALQVNTFACRLCCNENLYRALPELLFCVEARTDIIA